MKSEAVERSQTSGFTLVEMMVAMLIGLVLLGGVYSMFYSSSESYRRLQGLASIQERARIALNLLQDTVQAADYSGCRKNITINNVLTNAGNYEFNFTQGIEGYDGSTGGWSPAMVAAIPSPLPSAGDAITVRGPVGRSVKLAAAMGSVTSALTVPAGSPFVQGDVLMVVDCAGAADIFEKTDAGGSTVTTVAHAASGGNSSASLSSAYGIDSTVIKVGTTSFFIRNTGGTRALWWKENAGAAQEILEGVDGMQILYGVTSNTDTSANQYMTATDVDNGNLWDNVVSIRIGLLVATVNSPSRTQDTKVYSLLNVNYGPYNDFQLRRIFTTNIVLRNRSF